MKKNIQIVDTNEYQNLCPKYQRLSKHHIFKELFRQYIEKTYSNKQIDHTWLNYIVYYEINDDIHIYFRQIFIKSFNKNDTITTYIIKILFKDIITCIKTRNVILPINYLYDLLMNDIELIPSILLLKKQNSNKIQIKFKIYNDKIKFYIKYCEIFECNIKDFNKLQKEIYNKYKNIEKRKKKIIFLNYDESEINCEDTIYNLQKFMYENGYWLDIAFHFNKNNFQNNSYLNNLVLYFIKYDIILLNQFTVLNKYDISNIHNKLIITIPYTFSWDSFFDTQNASHIINTLINNNNIFYWGKKTNEEPENMVAISRHISIYLENYQKFKKIIEQSYELLNNKVGSAHINTLPMNHLKLNFNSTSNTDILNKEDFFKIHNLDNKKKLITIFTRWPKCFKKSELGVAIYNFERENFLVESSALKSIVDTLKNSYNIIFKIHPEYLKNDMKSVYINSLARNSDLFKFFLEEEIIISNKKYKNIDFFNNNIIVDNNYNAEIFKYTDFGIICYCSSVTWQCNMYNIPVLELSSKYNDWFIGFDENKFNEEQKKTLNNYSAWINREKYDLKHSIYGIRIYWEDIKDDLKNSLDKILTKDYKSMYKYFKNHPIYGDGYFSSQNDIGEKILQVVNKHGFYTVSNDIKYCVCKDALTIYQKSYIDVLFEKGTITIEILKNPIVNNNQISSGINLYVYTHSSLCKLNLEFDVKLNEEEKDVYIRLYNGIKWKTYENILLTTECNRFNISENFNLEDYFKWRLSTTSQKVGQKITINNLNIK